MAQSYWEASRKADLICNISCNRKMVLDMTTPHGSHIKKPSSNSWLWLIFRTPASHSRLTLGGWRHVINVFYRQDINVIPHMQLEERLRANSARIPPHLLPSCPQASTVYLYTYQSEESEEARQFQSFSITCMCTSEMFKPGLVKAHKCGSLGFECCVSRGPLH